MNDSVENTRHRLVEAALAVVAEHGVAGATSRQIAAEAGTNLQAITYHFGSKDALVAEALVGAVRAWVEPARAALQGLTDDPAGRLVRAVWELQTTLAQVLPRVPAYLEALALVPRSEPYRLQIRALLAELRTEIAGEVPGPLQLPEAMAALVLAAADGAAIHLALDPDGIDADDVLGQVVPLLLAASTLAASADPPTTTDRSDADPTNGTASNPANGTTSSPANGPTTGRSP